MTTNELLVLTLLAEGPRSGYDLDRVAGERRLRHWTPLGSSSLYYLLEGLKRRGWAGDRRAPGIAGPARRVFSVTRAGRAALRRAVREALAAAGAPSAEADIALMSFYRLGVRAVRSLLAKRRLDARRRLAETAAVERAMARPSLAAHLIFSRHVALLKAELAWIAHARRCLA